MLIVAATCWKCEEPFNIALIHGNPAINYGQVYGPEYFSDAEMHLAESHEVIIKMHRSGTRQEEYLANTCKHCGTFSGQNYHFEHFCNAVQYGDCDYKAIDLE